MDRSREILELSKKVEAMRVDIHDHIFAIPDLDPEAITLINDSVTDLVASVSALRSTWKGGFLRWLEKNGDLEGHDKFGEPVRYYAKDDKKKYLRDNTPGGHLKVIEEAMAAAEGLDQGSPVEAVAGCLSTSAWKFGALAKLLGEKVFGRLVVTETVTDVKTGKPRRGVGEHNKFTDR